MRRRVDGTAVVDIIDMRLRYSPGDPAAVSALGGDDYVLASSGNDTIRGGDGNDHLEGSGYGTDLVRGGAGNDWFDWRLGAPGMDTIRGGEGDDFLSLNLTDGQLADAAVLAEIARLEAAIAKGRGFRSDLLRLDVEGVESLSVRRNPYTELIVPAGGAGGFRLEAQRAFEDLGTSTIGASVTGVGDLDGDGRSDLLVGAFARSTYPEGAVYLAFGRDDGSPVLTRHLAQGIGGTRLLPEDPYDYVGRSLAAAGDVNGDGIGDLLIGAFFNSAEGRSGSGAAYVVFGGPTLAAQSLSDVAAGIGGFKVIGAEQYADAGYVVAGIGDWDRDGFDDIAVTGGPGLGTVSVVAGKADTRPVDLADPAASLLTVVAGDRIEAVLGGFDINADGLDDLAIGTPQRDDGVGPDGPGVVTVAFGGATGRLDEADFAAGRGGFAIRGVAFGDLFGTSLASGDINGDGIDDLVIGAPFQDSRRGPNAGAVHVIFGAPGLAEVDLADIAAGRGGFVIEGGYGDRIGKSLAVVHDLNGDGRDEILLSAVFSEVYLVAGRETTRPVVLDVLQTRSIDAVAFQPYYFSPYPPSDLPIAAPGDVDGDGLPDLMIGTTIVFGRTDWFD